MFLQILYAKENKLYYYGNLFWKWGLILPLLIKVLNGKQRKNNAGVTCTILGIGYQKNIESYWIFDERNTQKVSGISPYLIPSTQLLIVSKRTTPLYKVPSMDYGSKPADGGALILDRIEKEKLDNFELQYVKSM